MASRRQRLSAALLVLHMLALVSAAVSMQPQANPRGWQAAREAEHAAARAPRLTPAQRRQQKAEQREQRRIGSPVIAGEPAPLVPDAQQACSLEGGAILLPGPSAGWQPLAATAVAAFALGLLCGVLLLHAVLQRRSRQRGTELVPAASSAAASCAAAQEEQARLLASAGAVDGAAGAAAAAAAAAGSTAQLEQAEAAEAAGSTLAAAAAKAEAWQERQEEGSGETPGEPASEAAVAAAVQELVMQQGSDASEGDKAAEVPAASAAGEAGSGGSGLTAAAAAAGKGAAGDLQQQRPHDVLAVAAAGHAGALGALREEDRADVSAAAQLVLTMCRSMHVDPGQLSAGERLQLIYTMLQAWQAQQARRHAEQMHRLGSEANVLRSEHRDIAAGQAARQAARDAYKLSLERTAGFRRMCSDTLTFGLVVMVAAGTYQLLSRGLLNTVTARCGAWGGGRGWGLLGTWRAAEAAACYAFSVGDALLGLAVLLAAPWVVYRSGLMSDYHTMPVTKLFLGLGLVCGLAGYLAVGKLGGRSPVWLAAWEAWVAAHVAFSAAAHRMQRISLRSAQQRGGATGAGGGTAAAGAAAAAAAAGAELYEQGGGWLPMAMWVVLGVALPVLAGTLPFRAPA